MRAHEQIIGRTEDWSDEDLALTELQRIVEARAALQNETTSEDTWLEEQLSPVPIEASPVRPTPRNAGDS